VRCSNTLREFKENIMFQTPNQLLEMQKTQFDALHAFGSSMFQATEKLAQLNLATTRAFLQDSAGTAYSLLSVKDPQELAALSTALAQPGAEKLAGYARNAYAITSAASAEITKVLETQIAEGSRKLSGMIDTVAKSAPAGSEHVIGLIKNSLEAANVAYDAVSKAARQATETAESNISAAVAVATDAVKGKAKKTP
jgi:phasin family protein